MENKKPPIETPIDIYINVHLPEFGFHILERHASSPADAHSVISDIDEEVAKYIARNAKDIEKYRKNNKGKKRSGVANFRQPRFDASPYLSVINSGFHDTPTFRGLPVMVDPEAVSGSMYISGNGEGATMPALVNPDGEAPPLAERRGPRGQLTASGIQWDTTTGQTMPERPEDSPTPAPGFQRSYSAMATARPSSPEPAPQQPRSLRPLPHETTAEERIASRIQGQAEAQPMRGLETLIDTDSREYRINDGFDAFVNDHDADTQE